MRTLVFSSANVRLLFEKAYPQVQSFVRHTQSLGHIHYPVTTLGHLRYRLSFELR